MITFAFALALALGQDRDPEPKRVLRGHVGPVSSLVFKDGKVLLSASFDQTVRVWDLASGKELPALKGQQAVPYVGGAKPGTGDPDACQIVLNPPGTMVAAARQSGTITLWDLETGKKTRELRAKRGAVAFLADGSTLAQAGPGTLCWWDAITGDPRAPVRLPEEEGGYGYLSSDGKVCATIDGKGRILLREPSTGAVNKTLAVVARAVRGSSPDGKLLVIEKDDHAVPFLEVLEVASGKTRELVRWTRASKPFGTVQVRFSPDGAFVACAASLAVDGKPALQGFIGVWSAASGESVLSIASESDAYLGLAFAADGQSIGAGTWARTIKIWDLPKPTLKSTPTVEKK